MPFFDLQPQEYRQISNQLSASLDILPAADLPWEELHKIISEKISELIARNPEQLMQLLYRLDVSEKKVTSVLQSDVQHNIPDGIADLILERQLEKIKSRRLYRNYSANQEDDDEEKW